MKTKKVSIILVAGFALLLLAIFPGTSYAQDRDTVFLSYGIVGGGTLEVNINDRVDIDVYYQGGTSDVYVADALWALGSNNQYIDSLLSQTEGSFLIPLNLWELHEFTPIYTHEDHDSIPEGWSTQSFLGFARIAGEGPWLHFNVPWHVLTFVLKTADDPNNIGAIVNAIDRGFDRLQGRSNCGDTLGGSGYEIVEEFSPFHFVGGGYADGEVVNFAGDPIENATVRDENTGREIFTDEDGEYHFGLYPGTHSITFSHPDYYDTTVSNVEIVENQTEVIDIILHQLGSISGHVVDHTGDPIEDALVALNTGEEIETNASGNFGFIGLVPDTYTLTVSHEYYETETVDDIVVGLDSIITLDITMHQLAGIAGVVTDTVSGAYLSGAIITLENHPEYTDTSNSQGVYMLVNVQPGTYIIIATLEDYDPTVIPDIDVVYDQYTIQNIIMGEHQGIGDDIANMPSEYMLYQNYPNPFNATTKIKYGLPENAQVLIDIYDLLGRRVETLVNEYQSAGYHEITWQAQHVTSGTYLYRIQADDFIQHKTMLLLK